MRPILSMLSDILMAVFVYCYDSAGVPPHRYKERIVGVMCPPAEITMTGPPSREHEDTLAHEPELV